MKFRSLLGIALALGASVFLTSCGGGGASSANAGVEGGTLAIQPAAGIIYAGVPTTITVTGGRLPYTMSSSDSTLIPVPNPLNGHSFDVDPPNPSVVDTGLPPDALPIRTVNLTARDATGQTASAAIQVGRNFLTGYGFSFVSTSCATPPPAGAGGAGAAPTTPTAGCDTVVEISATTNGNLRISQTIRFDVVLGNFQFVDPNTGNTTNSYTTTTDHNGTAFAIIRVPANAATQVAVFRITDVQSGVSTTNAFTITGNSNASSLTAIPSSFTFAGALTTQCGTGQGDFFVFGGSPPYSALSSDPNDLTVTAINANSQPGHFRVTAGNPSVCLSNATIVVTDSVGARTTVTVSTTPGSTAPPAPVALSVAPDTITLGCGQSGSVSVVGGSGSYSATASNTDLTPITVSGHTVTITRQANDGGAPAFPATQSVTVTDGASTATVTVNATTTCP